MEGKKSSFGVFITIFLIILILGGLGFAAWKFKLYEKIFKKQPEPISTGRLSLKAQDESESFIQANYLLKINNTVVREGILKPTYWEEFSTFSNNEYTVFVWKDDGTGRDYNLAEKSCNYDGKCIPILEKEGKMEIKFLKLNESSYNIRLEVTEGKVKRIKAFIRWSENVVLVKNNLDDSEIPNHLRDFWDTSVEIGDVEDYIDFQIDISHYPLTESDYIEFLFADECKVREGNSFNDLYFLNGADVCAENAQKKLMLKGD